MHQHPSHAEINALAHQKWDAAGRPEGNDGSHFWHLAEQELIEKAKPKQSRAAKRPSKVAAKRTPAPAPRPQKKIRR